MRGLAICVVLISQLTLLGVSQQASSTRQPAEVFCTFDDGKKMRVQYNNSPGKHEEEFHEKKIWEPGGSPVFLFTQTALTLGSSVIPEGAYRLYIIPEKQIWTLVVNKNVNAGSKYDETQDLVRSPMQIGEAESVFKQPDLAFAHVGPKQCNMRLYYEKAGGWAEFHEK
jgi:hypothetical protein